MTPASIGWTVSLIVWLVFTTIYWISYSVKEIHTMQLFCALQFIALGFMWVFLGFNHGWW